MELSAGWCYLTVLAMSISISNSWSMEMKNWRNVRQTCLFRWNKKAPCRGFTRHAGVARAVGHTARDNHSYVLSHGNDHCFLLPLTVLIFRCTLLSNNNQRQMFFFPHFLLSEIGKMISYGHQINTVIIRSYRGFQTFRYLFQRRCDHLSILHLSSSSASSSTAPSVSSSSSSSSPKTSLLSSSLASTKGKSTWTYLISILLWLVIFSRRATLPSLESWQEKAKQQHNDPSYHTS